MPNWEFYEWTDRGLVVSDKQGNERIVPRKEYGNIDNIPKYVQEQGLKKIKREVKEKQKEKKETMNNIKQEVIKKDEKLSKKVGEIVGEQLGGASIFDKFIKPEKKEKTLQEDLDLKKLFKEKSEKVQPKKIEPKKKKPKSIWWGNTEERLKKFGIDIKE